MKNPRVRGLVAGRAPEPAEIAYAVPEGRSADHLRALALAAARASEQGATVFAVIPPERRADPVYDTLISQCSAAIFVERAVWSEAAEAIFHLVSDPDDGFDLARLRATVGSGTVHVAVATSPDGRWTNPRGKVELVAEILALRAVCDLHLAVRGARVDGLAWVVRTLEPLSEAEEEAIAELLAEPADVPREIAVTRRFVTPRVGEPDVAVVLMARVGTVPHATGPQEGMAVG